MFRIGEMLLWGSALYISMTVKIQKQSDSIDFTQIELDNTFVTISAIQEEYDLSYYQARKAIKNAVEQGVLRLADKGGYARDQDKYLTCY